MKKILTFLVLLLIVLSGCNNTLNTPAYYGEFVNSERTSYKDVEGLRGTPKEVAWRKELEVSDEISFLTEAAPTIDLETQKMYVVSGANAIHCIDLKTHEEVWRKSYAEIFPPDSEFDYSPVVYEDKLIVIEGFPAQQYLAAFDKNTGEFLWKSECIGNMEINDTSSHPLVINGKVYIAASSSENYKKNQGAQSGIWIFDAETGEVLKKAYIESVAEPIVGKYRSMFPASAFLAKDGTNIYGLTRLTNDSTNRTYIFLYDTLKNKFMWFEPVGEDGFKSPGYRARLAIDGNFVAVCMVGDQWEDSEPQFFIKVFDKSSQKPLWSNISKTDRKTNPVFTFSYIAIQNNKLYAMLMDKRFVCFDLQTGKVIWEYIDQDWATESWNSLNRDANHFREEDIMISKDTAYFNVGKAIYAFDTNTGTLLWRKMVGKGYIFVNIMMVDNGLIVRYQDYKYDTSQEPSTIELWM